MKDALAIQQCLINVHAILAHYGLPKPILLGTLSDRILLDRSRIFLQALEELVPAKFETWDFVESHRLQDLKDGVPVGIIAPHGVTAIRGWRERVPYCSLQVVEHKTAVLELDVDRWNPNFGAGPALLHLFECLHPGKTSPWTILRGLQHRGLSVMDIRKGGLT
jgi:hypothetical protein